MAKGRVKAEGLPLGAGWFASGIGSGLISEGVYVRDGRRGLVNGLVAYIIWGLFPLYWPVVEPTPALQILAHRMVWSLVFIAAVVLVRRRRQFLSAFRHDLRRLLLLTAAAGLISANWGVYIWAVNNGHVIETSLGYFINPLLTIALGVTVLGEHLRLGQWLSVGIGTVAVFVITLDYGRLPWIGLTLAGTFSLYGLVKKLATVPALESMAVETAVLAPPALGYLILMEMLHRGSFGHTTLAIDLLLVAAGAVTAIPLLCFAEAARKVPLTILGLLFYVNPALQFVIGVYVRHEPLPPAEFAGFALIWVALVALGSSELAKWRQEQREYVASGSAASTS